MRDDYEFFKINQFNFQSTPPQKKKSWASKNGMVPMLTMFLKIAPSLYIYIYTYWVRYYYPGKLFMQKCQGNQQKDQRRQHKKKQTKKQRKTSGPWIDYLVSHVYTTQRTIPCLLLDFEPLTWLKYSRMTSNTGISSSWPPWLPPICNPHPMTISKFQTFLSRIVAWWLRFSTATTTTMRVIRGLNFGSYFPNKWETLYKRCGLNGDFKSIFQF